MALAFLTLAASHGGISLQEPAAGRDQLLRQVEAAYAILLHVPDWNYWARPEKESQQVIAQAIRLQRFEVSVIRMALKVKFLDATGKFVGPAPAFLDLTASDFTLTWFMLNRVLFRVPRWKTDTEIGEQMVIAPRRYDSWPVVLSLGHLSIANCVDYLILVSSPFRGYYDPLREFDVFRERYRARSVIMDEFDGELDAELPESPPGPMGRESLGELDVSDRIIDTLESQGGKPLGKTSMTRLRQYGEEVLREALDAWVVGNYYGGVPKRLTRQRRIEIADKVRSRLFGRRWDD